jgi:ubiquinone/menaquinone biosynthesis C-methylase UbiE
VSDFDAMAVEWDKNPMRVARAQAAAAAIRAMVPLSQRMSAFEYGCGTGLLSFALMPDLGRIVLADSSAGMLDALRRKIATSGSNRMAPIRLDLETEPPPRERFDLVYTLMTLHHIRDTVAILGSFHAMLKSRGYLCIADIDREDGSFHGPGFEGHNGFDRAELSRMLAEAGFSRVSFSTFFVVKRSEEGGGGEYPLFLAKAEMA